MLDGDFPNSRCLCLDNVGAIDSSKIFNYTSCQCDVTLCRDVPTTDSQRTACSSDNGCTWATSATDTVANGCANCITIKEWNWNSETNTGACVCRGAKNDSGCKTEHDGNDNGVFWNTTNCRCDCQTQADENGISYYDTDNTATGLFCCPTGQIKHPSENRCCVADPDNSGQCDSGSMVELADTCYLTGLNFGALRQQLWSSDKCCDGKTEKVLIPHGHTCSVITSWRIDHSDADCSTNTQTHKDLWGTYQGLSETCRTSLSWKPETTMGFIDDPLTKDNLGPLLGQQVITVAEISVRINTVTTNS